MPPKTSSPPPKTSSPPPKESGDPMLQGTYVQEDSKDFEPPADEIAAFEHRLQHGGSTHSGPPRRPSVPAAHPPHTSKPSHATPVPANGASSTAVAAAAAQHTSRQRRLSEAEQEEAIQLQEDVDDVRQLDAHFGGAGDDSD